MLIHSYFFLLLNGRKYKKTLVPRLIQPRDESYTRGSTLVVANMQPLFYNAQDCRFFEVSPRLSPSLSRFIENNSNTIDPSSHSVFTFYIIIVRFISFVKHSFYFLCKLKKLFISISSSFTIK